MYQSWSSDVGWSISLLAHWQPAIRWINQFSFLLCGGLDSSRISLFSLLRSLRADREVSSLCRRQAVSVREYLTLCFCFKWWELRIDPLLHCLQCCEYITFAILMRESGIFFSVGGGRSSDSSLGSAERKLRRASALITEALAAFVRRVLALPMQASISYLLVLWGRLQNTLNIL